MDDELKLACKEGNLSKIVMAVYNNQATLNDTFLDIASRNGHSSVVKYLINNGCKPTRKMLKRACANGHLETTKYFIEECNIFPNDCIKLAVSNGHLKLLKYLIDNYNTNKSLKNWKDDKLINTQAIRLAVKHCHLDIFKYLIELGCDPHHWNNELFFDAIKYDRANIVEYYINNLGIKKDFIIGMMNYNVNWLKSHLNSKKSRKVNQYLLENNQDCGIITENYVYYVICNIKIKMLLFLSKRIGNKWLQMEILGSMIKFPEYKIMTIL